MDEGLKTDEVMKYLLNRLNHIKTKEHNGAAKNLAQLMDDGFGDCKDFTISRFALADALEIPHDHLAIIIYVSEDRKTAHGNLSIYHPTRKNWFILDGNGSDDWEERGAAFAVDLCPYKKNSSIVRKHTRHLGI